MPHVTLCDNGMANPTNTRWKNFMHNGQSQFMYIHENELKLTDLDLHKSPKCKLLVQLKLLPSDVSKEKVRVFVLSLIKSIDYEGGLLIELDDYVANLIGSEDLITKRKVKAMMTASNFELLKMKYEPKSNTNIAAYSKFKYIVVIDNKELKMNLEETEKLYRCEVRIFGSRARKPEHTTKSESEDESNVDDFSGSSLLDEPDGLGGDDSTADNEDNDGNGYEEVLDENEQNSKNKFVQLSFGDGQRKSLYPALKLETCKLDILRKHIYEGAIKHYNIQPNEIEAFYLGLALTHVDKSLNAKAEKF
ncbi:histone chaperone RTT106, partial [Biomphalaria glabrata]